MAYNKKNYYKNCLRIIEVYKAHKHQDVPDTRIVAKIFPQFNINISYRTWMNIKGAVIPKEFKESEVNM